MKSSCILCESRFISISFQKSKRNVVAIAVFPLSADDKESNSSGDGKSKSVGNSASSKSVNSMFSDGPAVEKATNSTKSSETPMINAKESSESTGKANNCDLTSDVMNSVIDTSGIKMEIKDDPDAPKVTKSANNIQPALGGSLLPPHAANAKHPVSIVASFVCCFMR